jgi:hypothetical protein
MSELIKMFEDYLPIKINEEGFPAPPLLAQHHDGGITMAVMAVPGEQIFQYACQKFVGDLTVKEVIFCVDQFTKPNQGTKYADALIVFWWVGEYTEDYGFRFGVVNYCPPPNTVIEPIDWNNEYWTAKMREIVHHDHRRVSQIIDRIRAKDPALVETVMQFVEAKMRGEQMS